MDPNKLQSDGPTRVAIKRVAADATDMEEVMGSPFVPQPAEQAATERLTLRDMLKTLEHLARSIKVVDATQDFPPWKAIYWWFRRFAPRLLS